MLKAAKRVVIWVTRVVAGIAVLTFFLAPHTRDGFYWMLISVVVFLGCFFVGSRVDESGKWPL
jgi:hypothetical protein